MQSGHNIKHETIENEIAQLRIKISSEIISLRNKIEYGNDSIFVTKSQLSMMRRRNI